MTIFSDFDDFDDFVRIPGSEVLVFRVLADFVRFSPFWPIFAILADFVRFQGAESQTSGRTVKTGLKVSKKWSKWPTPSKTTHFDPGNRQNLTILTSGTSKNDTFLDTPKPKSRRLVTETAQKVSKRCPKNRLFGPLFGAIYALFP